VHLGVNLRGPDLGEIAVFDQEMAAATRRGLPVAIHTVQGGTTAVSAPALEAKGYLGPSFLICHFLAATEADRQAMARTGTPLSFAVHSELRLGAAGDPRAALLRMLAAGVRVSLSIDAASLAPVNLFEAMNVAWNMGIPGRTATPRTSTRSPSAGASRWPPSTARGRWGWSRSPARSRQASAPISS
jgi:5-methylthioadenosine/S-adenosylhomocysteine deaminase